MIFESFWPCAASRSHATAPRPQHASGLGGSVNDADAAQYAEGLFYSGIALLGNTGVSSLRKVLARSVGNAQQVREALYGV